MISYKKFNSKGMSHLVPDVFRTLLCDYGADNVVDQALKHWPLDRKITYSKATAGNTVISLQERFEPTHC